MKIGDTEESCINFIYDMLEHFADSRYYQIDKKPVLVIYRPSMIVNTEKVLKEWRRIVKEKNNQEIYIMAVQEKGDRVNWCEFGYDAETEFQPKRVSSEATEITDKVDTVNSKFRGTIYDYKDLVLNKRYKIKKNIEKKVYPAVMPMWDNTARRNDSGIIYHGSTPELYGMWLDDAITQVEGNSKLDEQIVFVNAWNEWGEGTYLEPDRMYGYAYLDKTHEIMIKHD